MREHAFDPVMERRLFSAAIASPSELPRQLGVPAGNFACLLAWDARGISAEAVPSFVELLLRAGRPTSSAGVRIANGSTTSSTS